MAGTVYHAYSLPPEIDLEGLTYAEETGVTAEAAKEAVMEQTANEVPETVEELDWGEVKAEQDGWTFAVNEVELHGTLLDQAIGDTIYTTLSAASAMPDTERPVAFPSDAELRAATDWVLEQLEDA